MHRITVDMQMSSDDALATVVAALRAMPDVTLSEPARPAERHLLVIVESDDPDAVDIAREIAWQFDPLAIQHSLHLDVAS